MNLSRRELWVSPEHGPFLLEKKKLSRTSKMRIYKNLVGLFPMETPPHPSLLHPQTLKMLTETTVEDLENPLVVFAKEINQSLRPQTATISA